MSFLELYDAYFQYDANYFFLKISLMTLITGMTLILFTEISPYDAYYGYDAY